VSQLTQAQVDGAQPKEALSPQDAYARFLTLLGERIPVSQPFTVGWTQILSTVNQILPVLTPAGTGGTGACVYSVGGRNRCASPMTQSECNSLGGAFFPNGSCPPSSG
jgi:hypothetical protein